MDSEHESNLFFAYPKDWLNIMQFFIVFWIQDLGWYWNQLPNVMFPIEAAWSDSE